MTAVGPAHVLERHACVYGGRRFAHIVFEYRGERVSLLVTAAEGGVQLALPGQALPHVTSAGRIDDISVVSFRASGQMVFFGPVLDSTGSWGLGVVETEDEENLRAFAANDPVVTSGTADIEVGRMLAGFVRPRADSG